jgi:galactokinase
MTRPDWSPAELERRLDHFLGEDARIVPALDAFARADAAALGPLSRTSQEQADRLLGNQVKKTVALARTARESGAFAACSFGAGFGGSVWALVDASRAEEFARRLHRDAFVARPGLPLTSL